MGRIKTTLIKRVTHDVMEKYGEELTSDYKKNKEVINGHVQTSSKKIRNIVNGYATRLTKNKTE